MRMVVALYGGETVKNVVSEFRAPSVREDIDKPEHVQEQAIGCWRIWKTDMHLRVNEGPVQPGSKITNEMQ